MAAGPKKVIEDALGGHMTSQIWTSTYQPVFPFTPQDFSVGALLPMILYLFRWGHRRGKGRFAAAFGEGAPPTIRSVVNRLAQEETIRGFESDTAKAILGDFLLTSTLENRRHSEQHDEQVQRCFANHYLASWIDLPISAANLRGVPEMITALLSDQKEGAQIEPFAGSGKYPVGSRVEENALLKALGPGIVTAGPRKSDLRSDELDEETPLPLDQLVTVRLAQICGEAPSKAVGKGNPGPIPNQRPIAAKASEDFREDLLTFLDCYAREDACPRSALLTMLEAATAVGLTTIITATVDILTRWGTDGVVPAREATIPFPLLVDCSNGADVGLRDASEVSSGLLRQALNRIPATLMYARLIDFFVRHDSDIPPKSLPVSVPDGTDWLNLLGNFLNRSHDEARDAEKHFRSLTRKLRAAAKEQEESGLIDLLGEEGEVESHGRFLAEVLSTSFTMTANRGVERLNSFLSSALMTDEVNGLARRRKVTLSRTRSKGQKKTGDAVSIVLTNTVLEYLVHRHLRRAGNGRKSQPLSYPDFLRILRERYGLFVDRSPPNMQVPNELLQSNRRVLERRLRDLGLLSGVNDAERMKKLKPRYGTPEERLTSLMELA